MELPAVLDVVIGVVFVWFLLSLAVSAVNEGLVWATKVRAKHLWLALARAFEPDRPLPRRLRDIAWNLPFGWRRQRFDVRPVNGTAEEATGLDQVRARLLDAQRSPEEQAEGKAAAGGRVPVLELLHRELRDLVYEPGRKGWRSRISRLPGDAFSTALLALARRTVTLHGLLTAPGPDGEAPALTDDERAVVVTAWERASRAHLVAATPAPDLAAVWDAQGRRPQPLAAVREAFLAVGHTVEQADAAWWAATHPSGDDLEAAAPAGPARQLVAARYADAGRTVSLGDLEDLLRENPRLRELVAQAWRTAGDRLGVAAAKESLDRWFDDQMAQLSGFYRRQSRKVVAAIAVVVVVLTQVDSLGLADRLQRDQAFRVAVAASAAEIVDDPGSAEAKARLCGDDVETFTDQVACAKQIVAETQAFSWPSGTDLLDDLEAASGDEERLDWSDPFAWLAQRVGDSLDGPGLVGKTLTVVALLFGADFWFSTLKRAIALRRTVVRS